MFQASKGDMCHFVVAVVAVNLTNSCVQVC